MEVFLPMLNQMAVLFLFMLAGYILRRRNIAPENTGLVLSKLETYVFIPALNINNFMVHFTIQNVASRWQSLLCSIVLLLSAVGIGLFLSRRFAKDRYARHVYLYSFVIANYGFMGNAIIQSVFGEEMLFDFLIFTIPMSIFVYTFGIALLIPRTDGKMSLKTILSPMFISLLIGAVLGVIGVHMPEFISGALSSAAACMSPCAMLLTGFVVGGFDFKGLIRKKSTYIAGVFRLIIIPCILAGALKLLGFSGSVLICALTAYCMPMGLNTVIIPASYDGDTQLGAGLALISNVLSIITIPLMFLLFA